VVFDQGDRLRDVDVADDGQDQVRAAVAGPVEGAEVFGAGGVETRDQLLAAGNNSPCLQ